VVEVAVRYEDLSRAREFPRLHGLYRPGLLVAGKIRIYQEYLVTGFNLETGRAKPL
jgi:hypothetical protein